MNVFFVINLINQSNISINNIAFSHWELSVNNRVIYIYIIRMTDEICIRENSKLAAKIYTSIGLRS